MLPNELANCLPRTHKSLLGEDLAGAGESGVEWVLFWTSIPHLLIEAGTNIRAARLNHSLAEMTHSLGSLVDSFL